MLGAASIGFDISVMELVLSLCAAAPLVLAQERELELPGLLVRLIEQNQVNVLVVTRAGWSCCCPIPGARAACAASGRSAWAATAQRPTARPGAAEHLGAHHQFLWPDGDHHLLHLHRRHPRQERQYRLRHARRRPHLDRYQHPCPSACRGSCTSAGQGAGPGYLSQPELTGERFVDNPLSCPGAALPHRRSGPLVSLGRSPSLGRIDQQVKIRGFRIELGRSRTTCCAFDGVTAAAVTDRTDKQGAQVSVRLPVPERSPPRKNAIKRQLSQELPAYMIPAYFVRMDRCP